MVHQKPLILADVWRTCNKLRASVFRTGVSLWDLYRPLDPNNNHLISESQFITVLSGPLKPLVGLSEQEISELTDYFRVADGRVFYTQLCEVIHNSVPDFSKNKPLVTGLEWEDPFHCNVLSVGEERRLQLLLTKIAALVNLRRLILRPFFQDYELVAKNTGVVTFSHFARVLNFLNIRLSPDDFHLLVKKFIKDSFTVNYVAFVDAIEFITKHLDQQCMLDIGGDVLMHFPGRAITAELPKLPRPEIGKVRVSTIFGQQTIFHPVLNAPYEQDNLMRVMKRIQQFVFTNRVRVGQYFQDFDPFNYGRVTVSQFRRSLDGLGLSGIDRLYLSEPELNMILTVYRDPNDPSRMCWKSFEDDIDQVFTTKELEKIPEFQVVSPPLDVMEIPRKGAVKWQEVKTETRDLCEITLEKLKSRIKMRGILLKPSFNDYDKHNNGHVSRPQFRQCLLSNGILVSDEELYALEQRYLDDMGFNYFWFFTELEPKPFEEPLYKNYIEQVKKLNSMGGKETPQEKEKDIVEILAKIKGKVVRERIRVLDFLRQFDLYNENLIAQNDFKRGLDCCRFDLTSTELCTIMDVFASPMRRDRVDYRRFSDTIEEAFTQPCLERAPLIIPLQHIPIRDGERNFLNFDERFQLSMAMQKLAKRPFMNLDSIFDDFDRTHCGTVSRIHFEKALAARNMLRLISSHELEMVEKCFAIERGMRDEVDYRSFCRAIDILTETTYKKPF